MLWKAESNQQDGNGWVLDRKMLVVVPVTTRYTNHTFMTVRKKSSIGLFQPSFSHQRSGIEGKVVGRTTCLGKVCSCHFFLEGKGGDAMNLPCMTYRVEPILPHHQAKQQRESKQQAEEVYRERKDGEPASEHTLSDLVHCNTLNACLAISSPCRGYYSPQKPTCRTSPAALSIWQKGSTGKVLAPGHIPHQLPTCQEQEGGGRGT